MSNEALRRFQFNMMGGLQKFSISNTHHSLVEQLDSSGQLMRQMFHLSSNTEQFVTDQKFNVTNILVSRSDCEIKIKTLPHKNTFLNAIEAFGTLPALQRLREEIRIFENAVGKLCGSYTDLPTQRKAHS